jgi:hypothetical protein
MKYLLNTLIPSKVKHCLPVALLFFILSSSCPFAVELARSKVTVTDKTAIYLLFDEKVDGELKNEKSTKNLGKIVNQVSLHDGLFGKALETDGDSFVEIRDRHTLVDTMTVEFWMKKGAPAERSTILRTVDSKNNFGWQVEVDEKNILTWSVTHQDKSKSVLTSCRKLAGSNGWSRIALTWGSIYGGQKALRIFQNGSLVAEKPNYKKPLAADGPLRIKSPAGGLIDELAISADSQPLYRDIKNVNIPIRNLDFEKKAEGWVGVYDEPVIDESVTHSGKYSLKIETDEKYTREYLSPIFSVESKVTYQISFWAKVDKFTEGYSAVGVWIRWYFAPEETCSLGGEFVANVKEKKDGWVRLSAEISVPEKSYNRKKIQWARIQVKNYHSKVTAWVDDIEIKKVNSGL